MENDKTTLLVIAMVAMVAIVAAFGIVNMTGNAIAGNVMRERPLIMPGPCDTYVRECGDVIFGDKIICEKCCALRYACSMYNQAGQSSDILPILIEDPKLTFNMCMNSCPRGPVECYAGVGCADVCCEGYNGLGCQDEVIIQQCLDGQVYCRLDCMLY